MKRTVLALLAIASAPAAVWAKKQDAPIDPGPPPVSIDEFKALAEPALLASFFDPGSAQIVWDRGIIGGYWKPVLSKKIPGWWTCGMVNAKNRMGGYVGARRFVVVERDGQVVFTAVGDGGAYDFIDGGCQQAIAKGILPIANTQSAAGPAPDPTRPKIGIGTSSVADGIYIATVTPGSAGAKAGLAPGMTVSAINGVSLKDFDANTKNKMLDATSTTVTLTIVGKGDVVVTKAAIATNQN